MWCIQPATAPHEEDVEEDDEEEAVDDDDEVEMEEEEEAEMEEDGSMVSFQGTEQMQVKQLLTLH